MDKFTYENNANLDRLLISGEMEKKIQGIVRNVLKKARGRIVASLQGQVGTSYPNSRGDLRKIYQAVKTSTYKRILGGNISTKPKKNAKTGAILNLPRKLDKNPHQRGGNRMPRSQRTIDLLSYRGKDAGFILNFLTVGTDARIDKTRGGNRGKIAPRNWFINAGQKEMETAMQELSQLIDEEIQNAGIK